MYIFVKIVFYLNLKIIVESFHSKPLSFLHN